MNRIIFVPGKNPKPPPDLHRLQLLRCLLHGVRRIDPDVADAIAASNCFSLIAWNGLLYHNPRDIEDDKLWVDRLLLQESHREADIREARPVKHRLIRAMYQAGDHLPWLIPLIPDRRVKLSVRETEIYFSNHGNIGCRIRNLQKQPLRDAAASGDRVLLIGHSMGSVIAYDSLWELGHLEGLQRCADCFLTIGSPLGMHYVQRRLIGLGHCRPPIYPQNIRRWVNIAARGDLVALDPKLSDDFGDMVKRGAVESITDMTDGVYNYYRDGRGLNVHKSYGYLVNPHVARVIADWWTET
ncbi:MAG: hypothetical protein WBO37_11880 [Gammaproteobacteria bacterium]